MAADYKSRSVLAKFYVDMFAKVLSKLDIIGAEDEEYVIKKALMNPAQKPDPRRPVFVDISQTSDFDEETPLLIDFGV